LSGSSQYQDTLGQYSYGYADSNSQKQEVRTADGITHGGYSYVDGHGLVQSVKYHADALGFRVAATNLPVGPPPPKSPFLPWLDLSLTRTCCSLGKIDPH
ncbi:hypothetical protein ANN_26257, partial [Periplaneta americana]